MVKDLKEIIVAIKDVGDAILNSKNGTKGVGITFRPKKSLSRMAMDGMADFSAIVEDTIGVDEGTMVARALEKRFASFLMISMSMDPTFDLNGTDNLRDYVRQFHQNINVDNDIMGGTKISFEQITPERLLDVAESLGKEYNAFVKEGALILHTVYEGINSSAINMETAKLQFSVEDALESTKINDIGNTGDINPRRIHRLMSVLEANDDDNESRRSYGMSDQRVLNISSKFEKSNNATPTLLHIKVYAKDTKDSIDFVIGVHVTLHPVRQSDMILNLVRGLKNDDKFFNFIRWTTGETKFFKDFLFALDQLKLEAATNSGTPNQLFDIGRRKRSIARLKNLFTKENVMPNMTIIVTTDCLERIRHDYGYDITMGGSMQMSFVRKLMDIYFMLCFVVMDQGLGRAHILVDGKASFEAYSYATLQKEQFVEDKQMKEIMKMLGRSV